VFFVELDDLALQLGQVAALHVVLLVLLLKHGQVLLDLGALLPVQVLAHAAQRLGLRLLCDLPLKALALNALLEHVDLVLVESLNRVDHLLLLRLLLLLALLVLALLLQ